MNSLNKAWEKLFDRYDILRTIEKNGFYEIEAKTIREEHEPRLMAKFDHSSNLPELFKKHGLSILPVSRSKYVIGQFNAYQKLSYDPAIKPIKVSFPSNITTLDPENLYSESSALLCAAITGMIDNLLGEKAFHTVSGRMSSKKFDFRIQSKKGNDYQIHVTNSQMEIDGGYESANQFAIVEAKNVMADDFIIRQLYYPYRLWREKTYKTVRPVFLTYSNDIFRFFIYEFVEPMRYNSLKLVGQKYYAIFREGIKFDDIVRLANTTKIQPEPQIAFPQADLFPRIIDLLGLLAENDLDRETITSNYDFDVRHTYFYTGAGMYLGLIERYTDEKTKKVMFTLSNKGREIMRKSPKEKYLSLASCILAHEPFKQVFLEYLQNGTPPEKGRVVEIMKRCKVYNLGSESTYERRAQTVLKWVEWIFNLPNIYG